MVYEITDWIDDDELAIPGYGGLKLQYKWLDLPEFARFEARMDALSKPADGDDDVPVGEVTEREKRNQAWVREALERYVQIKPGQLRDGAASAREEHDVWLTDGAALLRVFAGAPVIVLQILTRVKAVNQVSASERGNSLRRLDSLFFSAEPPQTANGAERQTAADAAPPDSAASAPAPDLPVSEPSFTTDGSSSVSVPGGSLARASAGPSPGSIAPTPPSMSVALEASTIA